MVEARREGGKVSSTRTSFRFVRPSFSFPPTLTTTFSSIWIPTTRLQLPNTQTSLPPPISNEKSKKRKRKTSNPPSPPRSSSSSLLLNSIPSSVEPSHPSSSNLPLLSLHSMELPSLGSWITRMSRDASSIRVRVSR